jgi:hypothetical protein
MMLVSARRSRVVRKNGEAEKVYWQESCIPVALLQLKKVATENF